MSALSYVTYTGTGAQTDYTFPYLYLASSDVYVFVNGVPATFTFINASAIRCTIAPPAGTTVQIRRITQKVSAPVNFTDGAVLLESDLDTLATYALYLAQEGSELDSRITNMENTIFGLGNGGLPGTVYVQRASGDGATAAFTLVAKPTVATNVDVFIGGVYQNHDTFNVNGTLLTFTEAPPIGTLNIEFKISIALVLGSTDASLTSYTPAGTGAVATTVQAALRAALDKTGALITPTAKVPVAAPAWGTYGSAFFPIEFNLNNFPHTSTNGNDVFGTTSALTGLIDTPAADTVWPNSINSGIAGYARSASTQKGSVGVFGSGMSNANNTQQWGANFVATNFAAASGTAVGQTAFYTCGMEADVYINGASGLTGTVIGIKVAAAIASIPSGGAYGIEIAPANVAGTLGWSVALAIDDAPNVTAISIGSMGAGVNKNSQSITFNSRNAGGAVTPFYMFGDATGDFNIQSSGATKVSNLKVNNATTFGGAITLPAFSSFANDAAAAGAGVPIGGVYRNGSALQMRVT